ncbi:hypothetical protein BY996DRAFT_6476841 [Phakopsora pachyrhizi]|uniref:Uncharacterized protein n=1 Tax=Phakopsora pachyrhizi TaxID=170000 RepID=A0AAV0BJQ3_PHAPC|nr:hypothetical protein BY996DRAFT_6476841 [Phakopsora pachyrhizi]CAH7686343.1 hypothetical protein PPACK8108_LOCUS20981 [Phakopsora pachyrhizi]
MTTVKTIINSYQKQNQPKPQNHNHKLSPSDSSSSTSLSNSNNHSNKSNSNINIINQIYSASLISTSVLDWSKTQVNHSPYSCSPTPPNQSINSLIEIRDQRINHLETKIHSIKLNSSSASSLLTSSNPTSPSIFKSQLASSNLRYGRHLREQFINQLVIPDNQSIPRTFSPINTIHSFAYFICYYYAEEPIIKTSTLSSPTSTSSAMTTPHETSFVSNQTTSTPTLKDSSRTTTKSSTTASNLSKDDDQSTPCKSFKVTLEDPCYKVLPAALKK